MAITHDSDARDDLASKIQSMIDSGAGTATLVFQTADSSAVATINLQNPSFGAPSSGTITLLGTPLQDTNAALTDEIDNFKVVSRNSTVIFRGSVDSSGAAVSPDITLSSTNIGAGDTVEITSLTYTAPN